MKMEQSIEHNADYYMLTYDDFLKRSTEALKEEAWLKERIPQLLGHLDREQTVKVLSIGPGTGDKDACVLQALAMHFQKIEYTMVEPNERFLNMIHSQVAQRTEFDNVIFKLNCCTFDDFLEGPSQHESYHLILAIHVMYYADTTSKKKWIQACRKMLHIDGKFIIIYASMDIGISYIRYTWLSLMDLKHMQSGDEMTGIMDSIAIVYLLELIPSEFDLSCIFEDKEEGDLITDFITHIYRFRENASQDVKEKFLEIAKQAVTEKDGKQILDNITEVYILDKYSSSK